MDDKNAALPQTGGVNIGGNVTVGGDIVGRDKIVNMIPAAQIDQAFRPLDEAVAHVPEVKQKVQDLKAEAAKGKDANDSLLANMIEGVVALVPGAVTAVVGAFGGPILAGVAGPATKYVLGKFQGK